MYEQSLLNNNLFQNIPNNSLMYSAFTPVFGNMSFGIMPSGKGEVSRGFPSVPYLSLEALAYQAQLTANNLLTGQTQGTQNITGQQTVTDGAGNVRMVSGYAPGQF